MTTGRPADYVLFNPTKRAANKSIALKIAAKFFDGEIIDKATVSTPEWGTCHVAAYTDTSGAMIATTDTDVQFGEAEWHAKERIIMVREHPKKHPTPASITIYVCKIEDLFEVKSVGHSGVKWADVGKVKLFGKTVASESFLESTDE